MAVIALFSGSHCHGEEVASLVAERLSYSRIEDRIMEEASAQSGVSGEKLRKAVDGSTSFLNKYTHEREKNLASIRAALAKLLREDGLLFHDKTSHLLPQHISHILRVLLIANHDYRVAQAAKVEGQSEKDAQKLIHADDKANLEWAEQLRGKRPYDESLYDIVIPMHSTSVEDAATLICNYAQSDELRVVDSSKKAVEDAVIAADVNLALVNAGHDMAVTSDAGKVTVTIKKYVVRLKNLQDELSEIALKVPGVKEVVAVTGPDFKQPSIIPWGEMPDPPRILLVDDETEYVQALSQRLQTRDIGTSVVYSGEQALDFVENGNTDVMVLDLQMPGIDGIEVLRRVKKERPLIEVIILTGHGSEREEKLAEELGAFAYLHKPVQINELTETMKRAYEKVNLAKKTNESEKDSGE